MELEGEDFPGEEDIYGQGLGGCNEMFAAYVGVPPGQSGLVVPVRDAGALAEAIERLYRNPDLRQRLGKAARERIATDFHVEQTIRKTIELYESIATPQDGTHDPSGAEAEI